MAAAAEGEASDDSAAAEADQLLDPEQLEAAAAAAVGDAGKDSDQFERRFRQYFSTIKSKDPI
jgi:hypothetical protein